MTNKTQPERSTAKRTLFAIVGLLILSFALRPAIISIGPVLLTIQEEFGLSFAQASLLTTIPDLCMGVFALIAPWVANRLGADRAVVVALLVLGAAIVTRALAGSTYSLLATTVLSGIGIAVAGSLVGGWVKSHFPHKASLLMGVYATGLSVGSTAAAIFTGPIAEHTGSWRTGIGVWAILCLTAVISWSVLGKRLAHPSSPPRRALEFVRLPWSNMNAWAIAVYFGCSQFLTYALLAWLAPLAAQTSFAEMDPGLLLGFYTLVSAVANLAMGMLAGGSLNKHKWLTLAAVVTIVGLAGLAFAPQVAPIIFIGLAGLGLGAAFTLGMTLPIDQTSSPEEASAWTVFTLFIGYLVAALGPLSFGILRDHSGTYTEPLFLLLGVAIVMVCAISRVQPLTATQGHVQAV
ncbi:MFS transporter [Pseudomonas tructae]|uniref:MFS transporter n=1 Tax=Pseudomonas tructae TaxID=2518644 RepID=A0A411MHG7_9PSED|nr:MFS transporter [Pseudomonas tructae]QBF26288.1 MFS transporter [Pseudomonas tructae]